MLLVELAGAGGRLQHVQLSARCGEVAAGGSALITSLNVAAGRAIDAELGLARTEIGGFVAGVGGVHEDGDQWIVLLQQVPPGAGEAALRIRDDALRSAEIERITNECWVTEELIRKYFAACVLPALLGDCGVPTTFQQRSFMSVAALQGITGVVAFSKLVQLLCVELTNFPVEVALASFPLGCALPGQDHHCEGDVIDDILKGWLDLNGQPWVQD